MHLIAALHVRRVILEKDFNVIKTEQERRHSNPSGGHHCAVR